MNFRTTVSIFTVASLAALSHATVTFSNFTFNAEATGAGFTTPVANGNSVLYQPSNAVLVGAASPITYEFAYDATTDAGAISGVSGLTQAFTGGTATASYTIEVFDLVGGGLLGSQTVDAAANASQLAAISFGGTAAVHVVSSLKLTAPASFGFAAVAQANESVQTVPEPTTMACLGLGAIGLLRRRRVPSISHS
jgi:hypothetical protein